MIEETDNELMYQVRSGQVDRLAILYDRYQSHLFGFFRGMTQDRELSADLVQNVFYRILKYRHLYKGGQFKTWMFHIARNVHNDQYRRKNKPLSVPIDDYKDRIKDEYETDFELRSSEQLGLLQKAMAALSEDKREILLLSKYQEKNYKEIGEILGCNEGAVKVKVFRALNELKVIFQKIEGISLEKRKVV